jgi:hypothetical protein
MTVPRSRGLRLHVIRQRYFILPGDPPRTPGSWEAAVVGDLAHHDGHSRLIYTSPSRARHSCSDSSFRPAPSRSSSRTSTARPYVHRSPSLTHSCCTHNRVGIPRSVCTHPDRSTRRRTLGGFDEVPATEPPSGHAEYDRDGSGLVMMRKLIAPHRRTE